MHKIKIWLILFSIFFIILDKYSFINKIRASTTIYIENKFSHILNKAITYPGLLFLQIEKQKILEQENSKLKQQVEKYAYLVKQENNLLNESFAINSIISQNAKLYNRFSVIIAKAIIDINYLINNKLLINKGLDSNIEKGLAVINNSGVIGQISDSFNHNAQVTLITNPNFKLYLQTTDKVKMLAQGISNNKMIIKYINKDSKIKVNDVLYTTGLDTIYPANIPAAKIIKIFYEDNGFNSAICEPVVNFNKIQYILVLKNVYN
jgi:rod shape-determining protein MreC